MAEISTPELAHSWLQLDQYLKRADILRWLSSRYASVKDRRLLTALYAYYDEITRIPRLVTHPLLMQIRFQWWRDELEQLSNGRLQRHPVLDELRLAVEAGCFNADDLQQLLDCVQTACEAGASYDAADIQLMTLATACLVPVHNWGVNIALLVPVFESLRRGESLEKGPDVPPAPARIRPAVAHLRLRRAWSGKRQIGPLATRISILRANLTGKV